MRFTKAPSSTLLALLFSITLKITAAQVATPVPAVFQSNSTVPALDVTFGSTRLTTRGSTISITVPVAKPNLTFPNPTTTYCAIMIDSSVAGIIPNSNTTLLHWLQPSLTGSSLTSNTGALAPYGPPGPPPPQTHIYSIRLYAQPSTFQVTPALTSYFANISASIVNRIGFDEAGFVKSTGLGNLVAENFFLVRNETATDIPASVTPSANGTGMRNQTSGAMGVGSGSGFGFMTLAFGFGLVGLLVL